MAGANKAAPEEEMIEQPREPMFSKTGWMVLFGSNIIIAALVVVVVGMLTGGGGEAPVTDPMNSKNEKREIINDKEDFLIVDGCTALVPTAGSGTQKVSFSFLMAFDTPDQVSANSNWTTGNRLTRLKFEAQKQMERYRIDEIGDGGFKARFERELKDRFNSMLDTEYGVRSIQLDTPKY